MNEANNLQLPTNPTLVIPDVSNRFILKSMADYCEDCGCKVYNGRCTNCHEELYIEDQYYELDMPLPDEDSEFMKKANECRRDVERKRLLNGR